MAERFVGRAQIITAMRHHRVWRATAFLVDDPHGPDPYVELGTDCCQGATRIVRPNVVGEIWEIDGRMQFRIQGLAAPSGRPGGQTIGLSDRTDAGAADHSPAGRRGADPIPAEAAPSPVGPAGRSGGGGASGHAGGGLTDEQRPQMQTAGPLDIPIPFVLTDRALDALGR